MDPAAYDEAQYRAQLMQKMRASEIIVYQAIFAPKKFSSEPVLVAATSVGMLHVFTINAMLQPSYWEHANQQGGSSHRGPNLSFQAHPTQIYSLAFAGDVMNPLLISGGDQDFRVWKWKDILTALNDPIFVPTPLHVAHLHRKMLGFRGALLPYNEINDIAVDNTHAHLFLAGGDSAVHEWDLASQEFVRQYEGHQDYLHTLTYLTHSQEIVSGSEDGTIGIWDARVSRKVEFLYPQPMTTGASSTFKSKSGQALSSSSRWVGCVTNDTSEMWLACGGGKKATPGQGQVSGFMSMWHLPSRVPVHYTETRSDIHDAVFHHMDLLSVGNEASLKKWNRSSGKLLATAHSTLPSCQFCVVDEATDIIAVGGMAPVIDIYTMPGVVSFSLIIDDAPSDKTT